MTLITFVLFFLFNDPATTEIYTLSLHDALPILPGSSGPGDDRGAGPDQDLRPEEADDLARLHAEREDRKSTRLNSSHTVISYAVFCLKKKKKKKKKNRTSHKVVSTRKSTHTTIS